MRTRDIKHVEGNRPIPSWGFVFTSIAALMLCLATSRGRQQVETNARLANARLAGSCLSLAIGYDSRLTITSHAPKG